MSNGLLQIHIEARIYTYFQTLFHVLGMLHFFSFFAFGLSFYENALYKVPVWRQLIAVFCLLFAASISPPDVGFQCFLALLFFSTIEGVLFCTYLRNEYSKKAEDTSK
jgi:Sec-independent protein secretion pathway component TatC